MRIAVITPTKGDRQQFLKQLHKMIQAQTIQPDIHIVVDDIHECNYHDVTWRYKLGFERAREQGADVFVIMEDDDWYAPNYIQVMLTGWARQGKPNIFGIGNTIYYHLRSKRYVILEHPTRASMMATVIRGDSEITFCEDDNPFLDIHLWTKHPLWSMATAVFGEVITIGIKHGTGLYTGKGHNPETKMYRYGKDDFFMDFLRSHVGENLLNFYKAVVK